MSAVIGVGLDLIDLAHFKVHYGEEDPELLARCFTQRELEQAGDGVDRLSRLAARFAVKEAAFKALGGNANVSHLEIETVTAQSGAPEVELSGAARRLADERGILRLLVSLTHSASSAAAVVVACTGPR